MDIRAGAPRRRPARRACRWGDDGAAPGADVRRAPRERSSAATSFLRSWWSEGKLANAFGAEARGVQLPSSWRVRRGAPRCSARMSLVGPCPGTPREEPRRARLDDGSTRRGFHAERGPGAPETRNDTGSVACSSISTPATSASIHSLVSGSLFR